MELTINRLPQGVAALDLCLADEREILDQLPALAGWFEPGAQRESRGGDAAEAPGK